MDFGLLCIAHLVVRDQKQPHQRGVEDRLGDVDCFTLEAVLWHQGPTQGLAGILHVDAAGSRHCGLPPQRYLSTGMLRQSRSSPPKWMLSFHTKGGKMSRAWYSSYTISRRVFVFKKRTKQYRTIHFPGNVIHSWGEIKEINLWMSVPLRYLSLSSSQTWLIHFSSQFLFYNYSTQNSS